MGRCSIEWTPTETVGWLDGRARRDRPRADEVYVQIGSYLEGLLVERAMSEPASRLRSDRRQKR